MQPGDWMVPVLKTQATSGAGIAELDAALRAHAEHLQAHPQQQLDRRRARARALLVERLAELLRARHSQDAGKTGIFEQRLDDILTRRCDPRTAATQLLDGV
jgi:LAO/AO transport system kinase